MQLKCLEYPFDWEYLNRKKKSLKRELENNKDIFIEKKIAILGGSTTNEVKLNFELFLLKEGIKPIFYESEYNKYYEDALFSQELLEFKPDIVYVYSTIKNIKKFPSIIFEKKQNEELFAYESKKLEMIWESLFSKLSCVVIQNNFELPQNRIIGNSSFYLDGGNINFINKLNLFISEATKKYNNLYINDINYLSSLIGLEKWYDNELWFNYKYAVSFEGITYIAHSVASIIKSIYGKNKKAIALDLDNTLWGGVIGDDGVNGIKIGSETAIGEAYEDFQKYIKNLKDIGIILTIDSKNDLENALEGLSHPSMILHKDDFFTIKSNWNLKSNNILESAREINIGEDSFVFIDDNPVERELVRSQLQNVAVPEIGDKIELFKNFIDRNNYFEIISLSKEDLERAKYYQDNQNREKEQQNYSNYSDYLKSLNMIAEIDEAKEIYLERIYQLINKTNQFNLTTKRYTKSEVEEIYKDPNYILLYGKLKDKFGDNGLISIIIGKQAGDVLEILLWIMSCRVLKRDMEIAMLNELVDLAKKRGIKKLRGAYIPSKKNSMVKDHYKNLDFKFEKEENNIFTWVLEIADYQPKECMIEKGEY
ncbi:HAD-IIIC family phosphatase [Fusobacterium polymorphum]|jgi:fkbH domain|uniref:HAD-IIIC family phosphatase n=1 Tax=Fusobacterium nucleatum subsp. polymorphum TaxID=76857 RepID=UPI002B4BACAD|nr:HAD-IIIC family phosphatase [Fusobacterium polymorphum]WRL78683.1 HAD-IIIC family phosphatase [Fusobacterium polymorphum]